MTRRNSLLASILGLGTALALGSCGGGDGAGPDTTPAASGQMPHTECGTYSGRGCAPESRRVDREVPSFSDSTKIDNPLYPISDLHSALLLGHVDGKPFRTETTLLPGSRTVSWNGEKVKVLVSQYVAYLDGRLTEVALDRYAQADDGSVWYLGEDVFDYERGAVSVTEGTWLAGRDGPPAMIMPADPKAGDVYRAENIPGIVFEEVTAKSLAGDRLVVEELHLDGSTEEKVFARGYGEFKTSGGGDLEALALAVPTDARPGPPSADLESLETAAGGILESGRLEDWEAASATLRRMTASARAVQADGPPRMVADWLGDAMRALARGVKARRAGATTQAALDVSQSVLDLKLRHLPPAEIDAARFDLWTQQLRVHAAARDLAGVTGAVAVLEWIRDRIAHTLTPAGRAEIDSRLRELRTATDAGSLPAAADHAARLGARERELAGI